MLQKWNMQQIIGNVLSFGLTPFSFKSDQKARRRRFKKHSFLAVIYGGYRRNRINYCSSLGCLRAVESWGEVFSLDPRQHTHSLCYESVLRNRVKFPDNNIAVAPILHCYCYICLTYIRLSCKIILHFTGSFAEAHTREKRGITEFATKIRVRFNRANGLHMRVTDDVKP